MSIINDKKKINKLTISAIKNRKNIEKLTMITAYDSLFAKLFDGEIDIILVGDSLNMSFRGERDTLSANMEIMLYHTKAVCNGSKNSFIIADMPFGSTINKEIALQNSIRFYNETCADAIKIEGGIERTDIIKYLTDNGIAVCGHIGLMPQNVRGDGGYFVRGRNEISQEKLIRDAKALENAGVFLIVLEGVLENVAKQITESVSIPVIGIGAGKYVDGQVLVWSDMLGFFIDFKPKFVKQYLNGGELVKKAVKYYSDEVKNGDFPTRENIYK